MQIITFLFANAKTHIGKSIGFCSTIILLTVLSVGLFFVYKNISSAVNHYSSSSIVDASRVEITADSNLLTLFSRDTGGISSDELREMQGDRDLGNIEVFTLIEYPVLAKFSLFSFGLETDIPVFALSGGTLGENEVGISRKMLDYYNAQFAGSAVAFPEINEKFLVGQEVVVTVGGSKLFNVPTQPTTPINAHIDSIHPDYPGFGLVLRADTLESRLHEIGQSLGNPYKVVAYMQDGVDKATIKERYKNLNLNFDSDKIEKLGKTLNSIKLSFLVIFTIVGGIVSTIILFLISGIFRESKSIYHMIHTFGVFGTKSRILTLGEPIILTLIGILLGGILNIVGSHFLSLYSRDFLSSKGLIFPFVSVSLVEIGMILLAISVILITVLVSLDTQERRKTL